MGIGRGVRETAIGRANRSEIVMISGGCPRAMIK